MVVTDRDSKESVRKAANFKTETTQILKSSPSVSNYQLEAYQ